MPSRGLLLTLTEPPPAMREEFNAWYDDEHLAERRAIAGFRSATRWETDCAPGDGRYLATYELDSPDVLISAAYLARFQNQTPWSRRCLGKALVFKRWACEQTAPGDADPRAETRAVAVAFGDHTFAHPHLQQRRFAAASGERISLYELADPGIASTAQVRVYRLYGT
jgi:hypothetical protein